MNAIIVSAILGVVMMFASAFFPKSKSYVPLAVIGFGILLILNLMEYQGIDLFKVKMDGMISTSGFSLLFNIIITFCCLFYTLLCGADVERVGTNRADFFALLFFIACGIYTLVSFDNLVILFIGVEIISIPLYVLASSDKRNLKSNEAGLKYFLMGSFSTGIMLLGIAFLYGGTGTFTLKAMNLLTEFTNNTGAKVMYPNSWVIAGMMLIFVSMAFKASVAPFHFWTPDVYDGSPTVFTSFMSTIVKAAIFIAFMKLFQSELFGIDIVKGKWIQLAAIATALTLIIGNITAVFQQSVKRMLAYSSIAQAGFMMFAVMTDGNTAKEGMLLYTIAYSIATIGMFAVLMKLKDYTFEGFQGLAKTHPVLAGVTTVFILSLAGIPLTAGFFAKYYMLLAAVKNSVYMWLIIVAIICAAISIYYYFKVIQAMYFKSGEPEVLPIQKSYTTLLIIAAAIIIILGIMPGLVTGWL